MDAIVSQIQDDGGFISQSEDELRIQDGGFGSDTLSSSETWKPGPRFPLKGGWTQESILGGKRMEQTFFYLTGLKY